MKQLFLVEWETSAYINIVKKHYRLVRAEDRYHAEFCIREHLNDTEESSVPVTNSVRAYEIMDAD